MTSQAPRSSEPRLDLSPSQHSVPINEAFGDLARLVAHACQTPLALVYLADGTRQWFRAKADLEIPQIEASDRLWRFMACQQDFFVVIQSQESGTTPGRSPLPVGSLLRFLVGVPLLTTGGQILGAICALDEVVHDISDEQVEILRVLARQAIAQIELHHNLTNLAQAIAERQAVEDVLRQTESKYRSIFENAVEGIFQTTPEGRFLSANPALARLYGYESPEALIANLTDIETQLYVDPQRRQEFIDRMAAEDAVTEFESAVYRRDGSIIWITENARTVRDADGTILYYEGFVEDVTQHKRAEDALRESEQRFRVIFEKAAIGLSLTDMQGRLMAANPAMQAMLGYSNLELQQCSFDHYTYPDDLYPDLTLYEELKLGQRDQYDIEKRYVRKDGRILWARLTVSLVCNAEGTPLFSICMMQDITEQRQSEAKLLRAALHDTLTGLPNRTFLMERLQEAVTLTQHDSQAQFAVLFLDLDRFKIVNDSIGHLAGDRLLVEIAQRISACVRAEDTVARLGGDEFAILLTDIGSIQDAIDVADRIQQTLKTPFNLGSQEVFSSVSIGIASSMSGYEQPEHLLRDADNAMYRAKAQGKARCVVFDTHMHDRALQLLRLENDLRRAIERQEFLVYYQPIVSLDMGRIAGFEALVRWRHPERGMVSPADFVPIAEETGLILPLGYWVLRESCRQIRAWQEAFPQYPPLFISVNLSGRQFTQPGLVECIEQVLSETGLEGGSLRLEITESVLIENADMVTKLLERLRSQRIHLCIDDFGTGYSSLSYLHRFPVNVLKIDRSFINKMGAEDENSEIVRTIVSLAHNLGVDVTAEGVETEAQLVKLWALQCEYAQGHFFSAALSHEAAEALLAAAPRW